MNRDAFGEVYKSLKNILKKCEKGMTVKDDGKGNYQLIGPYSEKFKKELWFGAVQIKKNYVSYYLMPVYMYPELAKEIPPVLKKRMQGKSCFNFKEPDKELFRDLGKLTESSYKMFKKRLDDI
ncbi:MAG: hypothetical protein RDU14_05955 [Melioribacteraceae bacterium]|nr:hypothetical protein [Melioribacteraceae bacterium]